jgi:acetoin utilization deacetylase AcuC-like enzyme
VRIIYSPAYEIELPGHIWPTVKYRRVAERIVAEHGVPPASFDRPHVCDWDDLALVHGAEYLQKVRTGTLTPDEIQLLELPWVPGLDEGFRLMVGGTCLATERALEEHVVVHLGGGFHHAFAHHGEGFCLFNDIAVAVRTLQRSQRLERAAVIDCDVHHGNGTAAIFRDDPSVFTFSIHQQHNYPLVKPSSDLDIGLADGAGDEEYLARMMEALPVIMRSDPQLIVYLAGADPFLGDRLGGLSLTFDGLRRRDRMVFDASRAAGAAVAIVLAGGYAADVEDTVQVHVNTVSEALRG